MNEAGAKIQAVTPPTSSACEKLFHQGKPHGLHYLRKQAPPTKSDVANLTSDGKQMVKQATAKPPPPPTGKLRPTRRMDETPGSARRVKPALAVVKKKIEARIAELEAGQEIISMKKPFHRHRLRRLGASVLSLPARPTHPRPSGKLKFRI